MQQTWLVIFLFASFSSPLYAKCYYPDGSEMEWYHSPCDKKKQVSMCCAPGDECRPDGLCFNPLSGLWRDGCTDPSWESSSCTKLCNTGLGLDKDERSVLNLTGTTYRITTCGNGSYCCGNGTYADDCCKLKHGFFLVNGSATQANPISLQDPLTSSIFSSIASFTLLTSLSISAPTKSSSEIPSSSTSSFIMFSPPKAAPQLGVMVGAAVGGAGGVVVLILCALLWKRHRRTKSNHRNEMLQPRAISSSSKPFARHRESELRLSEPHGHNRSGEMDGAGLTLELDPSTTWHQMQ